METSGTVKGHSVNVISISLCLSPYIFLAFFPLCCCVSSWRYLSNTGVEWKKKGLKNGDAWGCFSPLAKQSGTMGLSLCKFFLFINHPFSLSVSISFLETRGVWIESVWRGCESVQVCEEVGLSNWWCPLHWSWRDAAVAIGDKRDRRKGSRQRVCKVSSRLRARSSQVVSSAVRRPMGQQFTMLLAALEKGDWAGFYSSPLASIPRQQSINPALLSPLLLSASICTSICLPAHILWQNRGHNSGTHFLSLSLFHP